MELCSKYKDQPAIASYVWAWGETGFCCAKYQIELNQIALSVSRTVSFAPLSSEEIPMERSERTKLRAEILTLEDELSDAKLRGALLYKESVNLASSVQALTVRNRELEAQRSDQDIALVKLEQQLTACRAQLGEQHDELCRLQTMAKFLDDATSPPKTSPSV